MAYEYNTTVKWQIVLWRLAIYKRLYVYIWSNLISQFATSIADSWFIVCSVFFFSSSSFSWNKCNRNGNHDIIHVDVDMNACLFTYVRSTHQNRIHFRTLFWDSPILQLPWTKWTILIDRWLNYCVYMRQTNYEFISNDECEVFYQQLICWLISVITKYINASQSAFHFNQ